MKTNNFLDKTALIFWFIRRHEAEGITNEMQILKDCNEYLIKLDTDFMEWLENAYQNYMYGKRKN